MVLTRLDAFLTEQVARPFVWGETDCALLLADWMVACGYPDPAASLRGSYGTGDECEALLVSRGGLVPVVASCAESAGLLPISEPALGCVGVIGSGHAPARQWGAIWNGARWMMRWGDQIVPMVAHPLAMWAV